MRKEVNKAIERIGDISKSSGTPKQVVFASTDSTGFKVTCEKCQSTIVAIVPTEDEKGVAVALWCMKCDNTFLFGGSTPVKKDDVMVRR